MAPERGESRFSPRNSLTGPIRPTNIQNQFYLLSTSVREMEKAHRVVAYAHRGLDVEEIKRRDMWMCSYMEAHIWDPDIKPKVKG